MPPPFSGSMPGSMSASFLSDPDCLTRFLHLACGKTTGSGDRGSIPLGGSDELAVTWSEEDDNLSKGVTFSSL